MLKEDSSEYLVHYTVRKGSLFVISLFHLFPLSWDSFFLFKFFFYYSWFTMCCQFLLYSKVTQLYIYIYSFSHIIYLVFFRLYNSRTDSNYSTVHFALLLPYIYLSFFLLSLLSLSFLFSLFNLCSPFNWWHLQMLYAVFPELKDSNVFEDMDQVYCRKYLYI